MLAGIEMRVCLIVTLRFEMRLLESWYRDEISEDGTIDCLIAKFGPLGRLFFPQILVEVLHSVVHQDGSEEFLFRVPDDLLLPLRCAQHAPPLFLGPVLSGGRAQEREWGRVRVQGIFVLQIQSRALGDAPGPCTSNAFATGGGLGHDSGSLSGVGLGGVVALHEGFRCCSCRVVADASDDSGSLKLTQCTVPLYILLSCFWYECNESIIMHVYHAQGRTIRWGQKWHRHNS